MYRQGFFSICTNSPILIILDNRGNEPLCPSFGTLPLHRRAELRVCRDMSSLCSVPNIWIPVASPSVVVCHYRWTGHGPQSTIPPTKQQSSSYIASNRKQPPIVGQQIPWSSPSTKSRSANADRKITCPFFVRPARYAIVITFVRVPVGIPHSSDMDPSVVTPSEFEGRYVASLIRGSTHDSSRMRSR